MPDLQLNYAESPPWLKNDAVESTFLRDVEAGQRINAQRQQLPLKLKAMQQDVQMQGLKIDETIRLRDETLEAERQAEELAKGPVADLLDKGDVKGALNAFMAAGIRNPKMRGTKSYGTTADDLRFALQVQQQKEYLDARAEENRARAEKERAQGDALLNPPDFTNITPQAIYDDKGTVITYAMPNGKGGIHYVSPSRGGQITFGVTPTGQRYATMGGGLHLLHDAEQEAKAKIAAKGLEDVNQRIRDIEASTRMAQEEKDKRLEPLRKQQQDLLGELKTTVTAPAQPTLVPVEIKSPVPLAPSETVPAPAAPAPASPAPAPAGEIPPRPANITDEELLQQARNMIKEGKTTRAWLEERLKAWGVKGKL